MAADRPGPVQTHIAPAAIGPACPQNWYLLARSSELKPGAILARPLGKIEIVLYRGRESGRAAAFLAHCAHAGCHLRHGTVVGDDLRCALHHRTIQPGGNFVGKDGRVLATPPQLCFPAVEKFGCIFAFAGENARFDLPDPEICAAGPVTTYTLPPKWFALPWSTLISNGMDIDHLQAVHDRRLLEPPTFRSIDEHRVCLSYRAGITGHHLSDRVMKWISGDDIRTSITCVGGSMMLVESRVGRHQTFVMLSMCPDAGAGSTTRVVVGVTGAPDRIVARIYCSLAAWLFLAFLKKDVGILQQMNWHEPTVEITRGDSLMIRLCDFFRGLREFDLAIPLPEPTPWPHSNPPAALALRSGQGA